MTRRAFLGLSAVGAVGGLAVLARRRAIFSTDLAPAATPPAQAPKPLHILILGGTGFTGPFQVRYALSRGHKVTVFNRGKTHPGELPHGVEQLIGDRNGQLDALKGRQWDVAIDNPTILPVWVRDAAKILKGNVERYVFISTVSVYSDYSQPGQDENGPLEKYKGADPMKETQKTVADSQYELYGPLKVISEREAQKWFPDQTLVIRPGLIVGPGDESDRFTYWPVRLDRGGKVLAPGKPTDPVQFIDARDLAEWTIRMVEGKQTGIYQAMSQEGTLTMGNLLDGVRQGIDSKSELVWADADFLKAQNVSEWSDMPLWVQPVGEWAGFARRNVRRALAKGLTFRPVSDTARATLTWFKAQPAARQANLRIGITPEREAEVLATWQSRAK